MEYPNAKKSQHISNIHNFKSVGTLPERGGYYDESGESNNYNTYNINGVHEEESSDETYYTYPPRNKAKKNFFESKVLSKGYLRLSAERNSKNQEMDTVLHPSLRVFGNYTTPEVHDVESPLEEDLKTPKDEDTATKLLKKISFFFLIFGMLAIASGGVAYRMLPDSAMKTPLLVCAWRYQTMCFFLIPAGIYQAVKMNKEEWEHFKSIKVWVLMIFAAIAVSGWSGTWTVALNFTSLTKAYLLNNCQPILMVFYNKCTGKVTFPIHFIGVFVGIAGLFMTVGVQLIQQSNNFQKDELIGDVIAFSGSIFACIYLAVGSKVRTMIPATVYIAPVTFLSFIIFVIGTMTWEKTSAFDQISWYKLEYLPYVAWFSVITGMLGITVISIVLKYQPALVVSVVLLFEPIAASILAIVIKVESNPGVFVWVGAGTVTFGIILVTLGYSEYIMKLAFFKKLNCVKPENIDDPEIEPLTKESSINE